MRATTINRTVEARALAALRQTDPDLFDTARPEPKVTARKLKNGRWVATICRDRTHVLSWADDKRSAMERARFLFGRG